jgi:hypothetical protein
MWEIGNLLKVLPLYEPPSFYMTMKEAPVA